MIISRRTFLASATAILAANLFTMAKNDNELCLYIGTYTSGSSKSKGIYLMTFNTKTGKLSEPILVAEAEEPSFMAISRDGKFLYSVNETLKFEGKDSGYVSAFAIDKKACALTFLNRQPSHGAAPCHISITDDGKLLLVANYLGGNVVAFPVAKDGSLSPASDIKQHTGKGPNADRQEAPHAHSVIFDHANKFAFVNDLGIDKVVGYSVDKKHGKLALTETSYTAKAGSGPRHFKFHPNGKFAFVNHELNMTVSALSYDHKTGTLTHLTTLSTLPENYKATQKDSIADLHISPDGKFLYVSNRGHDSIASFSIDEKTGDIAPLESIKTRGKTPRNFAITPDGSFLLAANQDSDTITVFNIDKKTGKLTATNVSARVPRPVCLIFAGQ